jgi:hypothetical protein
MIIAWGIFIISLICTFVWIDEIINPTGIPLSNVRLTLAFWFIITLCSAQYIWG